MIGLPGAGHVSGGRLDRAWHLCRMYSRHDRDRRVANPSHKTSVCKEDTQLHQACGARGLKKTLERLKDQTKA